MAVKIKFVASKRIINSVPALNNTPTLHCNDQPVGAAREISGTPVGNSMGGFMIDLTSS
jgi:hypothetical protein